MVSRTSPVHPTHQPGPGITIRPGTGSVNCARANLGLPGVGLVAGRLQNLPIWVGLASASPMVGITAPPPNYLLQAASEPPGEFNPGKFRWQRRLGVTHGIWTMDDDIRGTEVIDEFVDP